MHKPNHWTTIVALLLFGLGSATWAGPGAHGPNGEHLDGAASANTSINTSALSRLPDGSVNVPKSSQRSMGVRTVLAPGGQHSQTITLNGRVTMDPRSGGRVQAGVPGRIEAPPKGLPIAGQAVSKGEVLALLRPIQALADRGAQQTQLAQVRASLIVAEQRANRMAQLEGTVPRKDLEAAQAELKGLREQARLLGQTLSSQEVITAPVTGVIASSSVLLGQVVDSRDVLFEIIDPAKVLIEAETTDISLGQRVAGASLAGMPDVPVRFVGAARALRQGSLPLNFAVNAPGVSLAIGQPVSVVVSLRDQLKGVALPAQSVVRNAANESVVWIKVGAERFVPQPVQYQVLDARTVVITRGLAEDNRVVVDGVALINQIR